MGEQKLGVSEVKQKTTKSVLLGAAFLMATSSIGPGFLTQTTVFTQQLGRKFWICYFNFTDSGYFCTSECVANYRCFRIARTRNRQQSIAWIRCCPRHFDRHGWTSLQYWERCRSGTRFKCNAWYGPDYRGHY